ncbi:MAG: GTPase HflX [Deltaproteobacteria bacterium]|nr:GTPase HflX [Deltaproteobacteria bacterium]
MSPIPERVYLLGVRRPAQTRGDMLRSLDELRRLVDTAGGVVVGHATQELKRAASATLIHRGKVEAIRSDLIATTTALVAVDAELTPAQNRNLADAWGCKVLDRTAVILDIFARRARTRAGRLQVALAQLQYRLPRLAGHGEALMQQAGHIGNRGPGETKLEIDRRRVREQITRLQRDLRQLGRQRALHRERRGSIPLPLVALIGYTNAGKSTLFNALTHEAVLVEDRLFATLDPTVRQIKLPSGRTILCTDTVGFIRNLPHQLVEAFHATFEEVAAASLLCHIIDASSDDAAAQSRVVDRVLTELQLHEIPRLTVYNKCDVLHPTCTHETDALLTSATHRTGLAALLDTIDQRLRAGLHPVRLRLPYAQAGVVAELYRLGHVVRVQHRAEAIHIEAFAPEKVVRRLACYAE